MVFNLNIQKFHFPVKLLFMKCSNPLMTPQCVKGNRSSTIHLLTSKDYLRCPSFTRALVETL